MTHKVMDCDTANTLPGQASDELISASAAAEPTGAVLAYREGNVWEHVPADQEHFYRVQRGEKVRTVYVEAVR